MMTRELDVQNGTITMKVAYGATWTNHVISKRLNQPRTKDCFGAMRFVQDSNLLSLQKANAIASTQKTWEFKSKETKPASDVRNGTQMALGAT